MTPGHSRRGGADLAVTLGLVAWLHQPSPVSVSFENVPAEATSLTVIDWPAGGTPRPGPRQPMNARARISVTGEPGAPVVVVFTRSDGAYLADGPFTWPDVDTTRAIDGEWRRTIVSAGNGNSGELPLEWIAPSASAGPWPRCAWASATAWQCWGVSLRASGIVAAHGAGHTYWSAVSGFSATAEPLQVSGWGRLVRVHGAGAEDLRAIEIALRRPVAPPVHRLKGIRVEIADVRGTRRVSVPPDAVWLAADDSPSGAWIEVHAGGLGPALVPLADLAAAAAAVPFDVGLSPPAAIAGTAVDAAGAAVSGALVSLFRLIDPPETESTIARGEPRARRVPAGEVITGSDGHFRFERLPDGDFEVLAWHGQLGRAAVLVRSGAESVRVRLAPAAVARGRVVIHGSPAANIPIVSVPDPAAIGAVDDMTELKGGDGRSGPDGRFVVALAPRGGGELRIGGGTTAVRRVPLPAGPPAASIDLGDIVVPAAIVVSFVLDQDPGCDLVAVGPLGHAGLQIITAVRTRPGMFDAALPEAGNWSVTLACGPVERRLVPGLVRISDATRTINLGVQ